MLSAKLGKHNMYWGETLFIAANGNNYGQSALDIAKLYNVPGTEAKELFMPRNQLSMWFTVNPELTLGAQYFLDSERRACRRLVPTWAATTCSANGGQTCSGCRCRSALWTGAGAFYGCAARA